MKTPAKVLLVALLLFVGVFVALNVRVEEVLPQELQPTRTAVTETKTSTLNPFFIESLRNRTFGEGPINIERQITENLSFTSYLVSYFSDGLNLFALMNVPKGERPEGGFPVVIVNHGYIDPNTYSTETSYKTIADFYAQSGYLVLKPDYRGHANSDEGSMSELNRLNYSIDVLNLLASLSSLTDANPEQIYMYGHSMGGEVTLRVLEVSDKVKAATLWAPAATRFPENMLFFIRRHRPALVDELEREIANIFSEEELDQVSSTENTGLITTPIIIHHGTSDESVPYDWGVELDDVLTSNEVEHTFFSYPGEDHNFRGGSWPTAANRDIELFESNR